MNKIEVNHITKKYGDVVAVDDVSFYVEQGEILSLLGPSGCGKTTVLRSIAGLEDIDDGEILLDGKVITSPSKGVFVSPERRLLGLVFQSYALWPHMRVRDNIAYGLQVRKFPKKEIDKRVKDTLETVGLSGLEDRYPSQLSGGQQQRVALARNLAYEPRVLLLDEPLSNLDMKVRERMRGELHVLLKRIGITGVYVTHDQEEAFVMSDRIILMNAGKIAQEASPRSLYEEPDSSFAAEFIGRANVIKVNVKDFDEKQNRVDVELPDMGVSLVCRGKCKNVSKGLHQIVVRYNEIGLFDTKPSYPENVIKGTVVARDYRGSVTDHLVKVGNSQLVVTTHKYCTLSGSIEKDDVYLYIPPESIRPLRLG